MVTIQKYNGSVYKLHDSGSRFCPSNERIDISEQETHALAVQREVDVLRAHLLCDRIPTTCVAIDHRPGRDARVISSPLAITPSELRYLSTTDGAIGLIFGNDFFKFTVQFDLARRSVHTTHVRPDIHPVSRTQNPYGTLISLLDDAPNEFIEPYARAFVADIFTSACFANTLQEDDLCWSYESGTLGDLTNYSPELFDFITQQRANTYNCNKNLLSLVEDLYEFSTASPVAQQLREIMSDYARITRRINHDPLLLTPTNVNMARILFAEYLALERYEGKCDDFTEPPRFERARTNLELQLMSVLRDLENKS